MLKIFNNYWGIIIIIILLYFIIKMIYNFNKPIDVNTLLDKYNNQNKLKKKLLKNNINLSHILSYYFGVI